MPVDWDANVLAPLHEVFADKANYRPKNGEPYDIEGVFDRAHFRDVITPDGDIAISETNPILGVRDATMKTSPVQGDRVYIEKVNTLFVVNDVQPDSHGGTRLELNEVK